MRGRIGTHTHTHTHGDIYLCLHTRPSLFDLHVPVAFLCSVCSVSLSDSVRVSVCACVCQDPATPRVSPAHSPPENGLDKSRVLKKDAAPNSPASVASSGSTPSSKAKDHAHVSSGEPGRRSKPGVSWRGVGLVWWRRMSQQSVGLFTRRLIFLKLHIF